MKTKSLLSFCLIGILVLITGCSGSSKKNEFLGDLPAFTLKYKALLDEKKEEAKKATDMQKAFKYEKEYELLQDEYENAVTKFKEEHKDLLGKTLPFEALHDKSAIITEVITKDVFEFAFNLEFNLEMKEEVRDLYYFIYFKAVDSAGKEIPGTKTVASTLRNNDWIFREGQSYKAIGSWNMLRQVCDLADFAKVVEITKEEYNQK